MRRGFRGPFSGELPSYKIGGTRFDPDELCGWIAEHREADRKQPARREDKAKTKRTRPKATRRPGDSQPRLFE